MVQVPNSEKLFTEINIMICYLLITSTKCWNCQRIILETVIVAQVYQNQVNIYLKVDKTHSLITALLSNNPFVQFLMIAVMDEKIVHE